MYKYIIIVAKRGSKDNLNIITTKENKMVIKGPQS